VLAGTLTLCYGVLQSKLPSPSPSRSAVIHSTRHLPHPPAPCPPTPCSPCLLRSTAKNNTAVSLEVDALELAPYCNPAGLRQQVRHYCFLSDDGISIVQVTAPPGLRQRAGRVCLPDRGKVITVVST
jgi:hypothetical protein